jgi:putative transposase
MSNYRHWYVPGGTAFFTVVTHQRRHLFRIDRACKLLGDVMRQVREELPFTTVAMVLLPDHLHAIWSLPADDADFSKRWHKIKRDFTVRWLAAGGSEGHVTGSQQRRGHRGVWQRRFHEHQVGDDDELEALCAYIHYNPVKHGYVTRPSDWPHSTLRRFIETGLYLPKWGEGPPSILARISDDWIGEP